MASSASDRAAFAPYHRNDRWMIAAIVFAIWLAMLLGFGIDMVKRAHSGHLSFPLIVHLHALAYSAWLVLLAAQVWLARTGRVAVHRRLGFAALVLLPLMLILGPATVISQITNNPYMPDRWIAWMSVQFTTAFGSAVLLTAGFLMRHHPAAHKRLMLMGTIALTEPGFGRIWLTALQARWGEGYLPFYFSAYIGTFALIIAVGAYDLATRRRLHPAYIGAALWIFANEALATWLFYQPFWLAWMKALTGHVA
jgi:hypothetical protein